MFFNPNIHTLVGKNMDVCRIQCSNLQLGKKFLL